MFEYKNDGWLGVEYTRNDQLTPAGISVQHSVTDINLMTPKERKNLGHKRRAIEKRFSKRNFVLLYHGTSVENAFGILDYGIDLTKGRSKQDFSNKDGFYLHFDFNLSVQWASKKYSNQFAILIFRVSEYLLNPLANRGFNLCDNNNPCSVLMWPFVVRSCRQGYKPHDWIGSLLDTFHFIVGPMCANPREVQNEKKDPKFLTLQNRVPMQLCVRTPVYASVVGSIYNICGVVFNVV